MTNKHMDLIILKAKPLQVRIRLHPGIKDFFRETSTSYTAEISEIVHDYAMAKMSEEDLKKYILPYEDNQNRFIGG